jgi:hypothetical protein
MITQLLYFFVSRNFNISKLTFLSHIFDFNNIKDKMPPVNFFFRFFTITDDERRNSNK